MVFIDLFQKCPVKGLTIRKILRRDADGINSVLLRPGQRICILIVADDTYDFRIGQAAAANGIDNSLQIGASAGYTHQNSQHNTTPFSPASTSPIT